MQYISLNYKISETRDLKLSFENRGFLFGDGFFETIKRIIRSLILKCIQKELKNH